MISRQKLLEAAARVFAESGFRGATTRRIAEAAGVNEVTLFRLFGNKSHLLSEAMQCLHHELKVELPEDPGDVEAELLQWAEAHLQAMRDMRPMIRRTMAELEEHPAMREVVCSAQAPVFERLVSYVSRAWPPADAAGETALRTACSMLDSALFSDAIGRDIVPVAYPEPGDQAAAMYVQAFLRLMGPVAHAAPAGGKGEGQG